MKNGLAGSERVRTSSKAEARIIEMLKEHQPIERFALLHTNAPREANAFLAKIKNLLPDNEIYSMDITPVIGVHIGPGLSVMLSSRKHRLENETTKGRKIMDKVTIRSILQSLSFC